MSINADSLPSKCFEFLSNWFDIISMHCLLRLAESVDVDDGD